MFDEFENILENRSIDKTDAIDYAKEKKKIKSAASKYPLQELNDTEKLLVNNFGVYAGKQNFNLSPDKKTSNFNWSIKWFCKTTFLQAVDFVLYGKQSNIFQNSKLSYENFLKKYQ